MKSSGDPDRMPLGSERVAAQVPAVANAPTPVPGKDVTNENMETDLLLILNSTPKNFREMFFSEIRRLGVGI